MLALSAGAGLAARAERPEPVPVRASFDRFPMQVGDWRGVQEPAFDANILAVLGVDLNGLRDLAHVRAGDLGLLTTDIGLPEPPE